MQKFSCRIVCEAIRNIIRREEMVKIVTDSTAYLEEDFIRENDIIVVLNPGLQRSSAGLIQDKS